MKNLGKVSEVGWDGCWWDVMEVVKEVGGLGDFDNWKSGVEGCGWLVGWLIQN